MAKLSSSSHSLSFLIKTYGVQVAAGGTQFLCILLLENRLQAPTFSKISLVLSFFATYMLTVDLGIQGDFIRQLSKGQPGVFKGILRVRLLAAVAASLLMTAMTWLSDVSADTLIYTAIFSLCLVPAAVLFTTEALGYVTSKTVFTTALRLARLVSFLIFTTIILAAVRYGEATSQVDLEFKVFASAFCIFPIGLSLFAWVVYRKIDRSLKAERQAIAPLLKSILNLISSRLLSFLFGSLFIIYNVRAHGDGHLAEFTIAQTLIIPIALIIQVGVYSLIAKTYQEGLPKRPNHSLLVATCGFLGYACLMIPETVFTTLFSNVDHEQTLLFFVPLALAQLFSGYITLKIVEAQNSGRKWLPIVCPLVAILTLGIFVLLTPHVVAKSFTGVVFAVCGFASLVTILLGLKWSSRKI